MSAAVHCEHGTNAGHTKEAVEYHKFADDLQIYISYHPHVPDEWNALLHARLCDCISYIKCWMVQHNL